MGKNRIIDFMFDELENNGVIRFNEDIHYSSYLHAEQKKSEKLTSFIRKTINSSKLQNTILQLIDNYADSIRDTSYHAKRLYYYQGVKDGITFISK